MQSVDIGILPAVSVGSSTGDALEQTSAAPARRDIQRKVRAVLRRLTATLRRSSRINHVTPMATHDISFRDVHPTVTIWRGIDGSHSGQSVILTSSCDQYAFSREFASGIAGLKTNWAQLASAPDKPVAAVDLLCADDSNLSGNSVSCAE